MCGGRTRIGIIHHLRHAYSPTCQIIAPESVDITHLGAYTDLRKAIDKSEAFVELRWDHRLPGLVDISDLAARLAHPHGHS
jgi:hypothetical protein